MHGKILSCSPAIWPLDASSNFVQTALMSVHIELAVTILLSARHDQRNFNDVFVILHSLAGTLILMYPALSPGYVVFP